MVFKRALLRSERSTQVAKLLTLIWRLWAEQSQARNFRAHRVLLSRAAPTGATQACMVRMPPQRPANPWPRTQQDSGQKVNRKQAFRPVPQSVTEFTRMPFIFQAEDGIRDLYVTGVQTCALPIFFLCRLLGWYVRFMDGTCPSGRS